MLLTLAAAGSIGGGCYYWWLTRPPPMPTNIDEAIAIVSDPRYLRLPESRREPYLAKSRELAQKLGKEDRERIRKQVENNPELRKAVQGAMEDQLLIMARDYAKADAVKRKVLVEMAVWGQELGRRRAQESVDASKSDPEAEKRREEQRNEFVKYMENRVEHGNPARQGYAMEFFKAIADRRRELGMDPNPPPPGRK